MAKDINRKVTIYVNGKEVENTIKSLRSELKRLENAQKNCVIGTPEFDRIKSDIEKVKNVIYDATSNTEKLGLSWKDASQRLSEYSNILMGVQTAMEMVDATIGTLKDLSHAAAELDDVYADVQKTTGLTKDQVESLNKSFSKMDTRTSREQLNQLAYEAGKLGISTEKDVLGFVSAADKINIALGDVLGDGAMVTIGKLSEVYAKSTKQLSDASGDLETQMLRVGSAVNQLGQSSTANEAYLVEFLSRMGGIAVQANLSADAILGFASALDQDMMKQEMSATAFQKFIMQMIKKPAEFAKSARMDVKEFTDLMQSDMNEALLRVLEGFQGAGGLIALQPIFEDLGLDAQRAASVISSMAESIDKVRKAQAIANSELESGNSIMNEFNTKNNTMQAEAEKAKKRFEDVRIELGNELYPVLIKLQKTSTVGLKAFAEVIKYAKENQAVVWLLVSAIAALNAARLKSWASSAKDFAASVKSSVLKKQEEMQIRRNERAEARLQVQKEKSRLAYLKEQLAINKKILADKAEYASIGANSVVLAAERNAKMLNMQITKQQTVVTNAATVANKALTTSIKATPWGAVLLAVTALVAGITKLVEKSREVKKAAQEIGNAGAEAEGRVRVFMDRLDDSKKGTDDYRKALEELRQLYPEIIQSFLDEEGALKDVKAALDAVSEASRQAAMDQLYNEKAGELYTQEAEKVAGAMSKAREVWQKTSKSFWKAGTTVAQREEAWKRYSEWIQKAKSGTVSWDEAIEGARKDLGAMGYVLTSTFGSGSNDMIYQMREMKKAANETDNKIKELNETIYKFYNYKPTNTDPFGVDNMNLGELKNALDTAKRLLKSYEKAADEGREGFAQKAETERKRIAAIQTAMKSLEQASSSSSSGGYSGPHKETKAEKAARLAEEAWNRFSDSYNRTIEKIQTKSESGIKKLVSEIDNSIAKMESDLAQAQKKHPEATSMIEDLRKQANEWKKSEIEKYIKKAEEGLAKMQDGIRSVDNESLSKVQSAVAKLKNQFKEIDDAIQQYEKDIENVDESEKTRLEGLIKQYKNLKNELANAVLIDVVKMGERPSAVSGRDAWSESVRKKVEDATAEDMGVLFDKSDMDAYGEALADIEAKYDNYKRKKLDEAKVEDGIVKALQAQIDAELKKDESERNSSLISSLEAEKKRHEENAASIGKEIDGIQKLQSEAEEVAKKNTLGTFWERLISGIEKYTSVAMEIFGSINKMIDNQANKELKRQEEQKNAAIENLDEQLKEGLISQEEYNEQKQELEDEYTEKEKQTNLAIWKRQKALSLSEASIQSALAVLKAWNSMPYPANLVPVGIATAMGAAQIAAIATEPAPYAKGGYVPREQIYKAGEAGPEWVASNKLLADQRTAPIIEALEKYQRGNTKALDDIPMARLNADVAMAAARELGSRAFERSGSALPGTSGADEQLKVLKEVAAYLKDPRNRQAVISRQTLDDFERGESFLRNKARL